MEDFNGLIERFDHVAYGVKDIAATLPLVELLAGEFIQGGDHLRNRFRWVQFRLPGGSKLELLQPLDSDSFLQRFIDGRGEGVHHLTFKVSDVEKAAVRAEELGFTTTGLSLHPDWSEVFLHPRAAHGTVIQLAAWQNDLHWQGKSLDEVLAGLSLDLT
jgi:methylmalonyl-CoA/ethylmalonyl-CoA epimerase